MDIQRFYETLELDPDASIEEVRQTYKDLVNIWHPDRVANNPRLKQKAEEKLKQINVAYEGITSFLSSKQKGAVEVEKAPQTQQEDKTTYHKTQAKSAEKDREEVHVQTGSHIVSTLWSYLSDILRSFVDSQVTPKGEARSQPYSADPGQRQTQKKGMGRGRGSGMGRGKGMGRGRGRR